MEKRGGREGSVYLSRFAPFPAAMEDCIATLPPSVCIAKEEGGVQSVPMGANLPPAEKKATTGAGIRGKKLFSVNAECPASPTLVRHPNCILIQGLLLAKMRSG